MKQLLSNVIDIASTYGGKIVLAIVVTVVGLIVIKLLSKAIAKAFSKSKLDERAQSIITKLIKALLFLILIIAIVEILGVPMTSVVALLASCGLAVGLAFQGALANFAGGLMILVFRPFKIGDYVNASGAEGVVTDISIFYTKLLTLDNKRVLVPNGDLMNSNVTNFTAMGQRRVDLDFKITNDIDQELVKKVLLGAAVATKGVLEDPAAFARLTAVDDDTYIFTVRAWCKTDEYWDTYFDLIENCSTALAENGIDDPEERLAVRIVEAPKD
ncbi:MAG: mechanosensitive ion channel [Clostridia bacterium]|nr:mechanosensitive ion channel [Clostridia bacterium]